MEVSDISINHMREPIGYDFAGPIRIEFAARLDGEGEHTDVLKRAVISESETVYDSRWQQYDGNVFDVALDLSPRTRYTVTVMLKDGENEIEGTTFFETGKMDEPFAGSWIGNPDKDLQNTLLRRCFKADRHVVSARLYVTGLGLYEAYLDGEKIGDEYLAPGTTAYDKLVQVQTYDMDNMFAKNEFLGQDHELVLSLADGWYKGNFGFDGGRDAIYGDRQMAIAELRLRYEDGSEEVIASDTDWETTSGRVTKSAIYYGEDYDDTIAIGDWQPAVKVEHGTDMLSDRLSPPIAIDEYLPVKEVITTPAGETVLDFGQNQAGWPEFFNREPKGTTVTLQVGEILQNGNFYRDNLREARAAFQYTSDGEEKWVRPHFTYYGYRYVKVTGNTKPVKAEDFRAAVMFSKMDVTGGIETDRPKVNRLLSNILWSQKSNFFDVPTDCPQRDERLGWSGDADVFSATAVLNMDAYAFYKKYAKDMGIEQAQHDGMLTMYAPAMGVDDGGAAVWGDAATIVPWNVFEAYGDPAILRQNYRAMKSWVDWIGKATKTKNLWTGCFQFGDWLSMDGENPAMPTGRTDEDFIASVYYFYSSSIVARSAKLLGHDEDAEHYASQAKAIKAAIAKEYITANGRLAIDTQTAYALALYFDLVPEDQKQRVLADLVTRLDKDNNHLKTGFVGTPLICQVLSDNGQHKLATQIFLNEDFPSWLYEVNLGATTVWERWNSVLADGSMNPAGMNSLNHYSIGAIMEWVYRYMLGIAGHEHGYRTVTLAPQFDYRLKHVRGHYRSSYGDLRVEYQLESDARHTVTLDVEVPFGQSVTVKLPRSRNAEINVNGQVVSQPLVLTNGTYHIAYRPDEDYIEHYNLDMPAAALMADKELLGQLEPINGVFGFLQQDGNLNNFGSLSLVKMNTMFPFVNISTQDFGKIKAIMDKTPLESERRFLDERRSL
ncbi:alpha-L-rhamnosidase [Bifidobacterium sp. ESL0764]|uniref:alpha-L-rhamnosidase n=1 Tax=Bifidobacterium sp. ESL0764 TaxID=2983228 RepID=UPI0023F62AF6|nr:alpha-L-rhamnosidase [Bifidobacterium sp. ESL0764]WEV66236.1 family 78 glycoside hydrolase catalytic domain [Bifidobacterium sp. ESL0764]